MLLIPDLVLTKGRSLILSPLIIVFEILHQKGLIKILTLTCLLRLFLITRADASKFFPTCKLKPKEEISGLYQSLLNELREKQPRGITKPISQQLPIYPSRFEFPARNEQWNISQCDWVLCSSTCLLNTRFFKFLIIRQIFI